MSSGGAPSPRRAAIAVWTGSRVLVWGGTAGGAPVAGGGLYDDANDTWSAISAAGAPSPRTGVGWAWSGKKLLLFGGSLGGADMPCNEGYAYDPATNSWVALALACKRNDNVDFVSCQ